MKEEIMKKGNSNIHRGPEAKIALCKCKEAKKTYGVRMEGSGDEWITTWAFPIEEDTAKREGYDATILKGMLGKTPDYPGCPYCGTKHFVVCGNCKRLNCNIVTGNTFTCDWCGFTGSLSNYDGQGVASGGDRG